jgi:hypothetical protein
MSWDGTNKKVTHTSPDGKYSVSSHIPVKDIRGVSYSSNQVKFTTDHTK